MLYPSSPQLGQSFRLVQGAFLQADGLPFADVLSEEQIQQSLRGRGRPVRSEGRRRLHAADHLVGLALSGPARRLIRKTMAQAAVLHARTPRQISFAGALQAVAAGWDHGSVATPEKLQELARVQLKFISKRKAGHRPDRVEPRALKRRPKRQKLLTKPRQEAREQLLRTSCLDTSC